MVVLVVWLVVLVLVLVFVVVVAAAAAVVVVGESVVTRACPLNYVYQLLELQQFQATFRVFFEFGSVDFLFFPFPFFSFLLALTS